MPDATYAITSFHGGEISKHAQGRFDRPDYRISLNICLNAFPTEIGAWSRRSGTQYAGHTRAGAPGRVIKFDFQQSNPYTLEFTDGKVRFRSGVTLVPTNDDEVVVAVSAANPAVVQTTNAVDWVTGDTLVFPGASTPLLEARQFTATKVDTTHFELADAITGTNINGATLGALTSGATVARLHELVTLYTGDLWSDIRAVQAEKTSILLSPSVHPQMLTVTTDPSDTDYAQFSIARATLNDGPYFDPFTNGVQATPSAKVGIISLTLSFPAYSATKSYRTGEFVTTGGVNYRSLADQNVNHAPAGLAPWWIAASASEAINDGDGFMGSDIGRLVRLFSEPAAWDVATAYAASTAAAPVIVSYNPTGLPDATLYYQATVASTGKVPGTDLTNWTLVPQGAAIWSWGKITSLSNVINRSSGTNIGDMTAGGGLAGAFDGVFSQASSASAAKTGSTATPITLSGYVGKNFTAVSDQVIEQATIWPSNNIGFVSISYAATTAITFNLRGKASAPASASDGTLLGTTGSFPNTTSAVTITSTDQVTAWKYFWIEMLTTVTNPSGGAKAFTYTTAVAEVAFFNPSGTGTSTGVNVEILGAPLLYTTPILIWRLGLYSDTTGYPTCGIYYEGRVWFGGAVANRFDACVSNGINGTTINFAPTNLVGTVSGFNAISYTLNSNSVNQITDFRADSPGLLACTLAGEFLIQAPAAGPLTPINVAARLVTNIGSKAIAAVRTEHTSIFAKRYGRKLIDYFADTSYNKPTGQVISERAEHIVATGIAELAYVAAVTPIIWGRTDDGGLFGVTYRRDTMTTTTGPNFAGFHRHELGTGREVESICGGPSPGGELDALTMVTNQADIAEADVGVRHVEILTDMFDEAAELVDAWFLDDAVNPTSVTSSRTPTVPAPYGSLTINGLWHLNGKTVQVFAGGLDCGDPGEGNAFADFLVADGSILIPYGDSISAGAGRGLFTADFAEALALTQIVVGLTYDSDGQLVRPVLPADTGARTGPALGKTRRTHRYVALLSNTLGISFGTELTATSLKPALFRKAGGDPIAALTTFSDVHSDLLTADYNYDNMACWRVSRPWPATVVAFEAFIQTQDR